MDLERDRARYEADRAKDLRLAATHGIDEVMKAQRLDALLFPGGSGAAIAARPGYPTVIVPVRRSCRTRRRRRSPQASTRSRRPSASASPAWPAASRGSSSSRTRSSRPPNVESSGSRQLGSSACGHAEPRNRFYPRIIEKSDVDGKSTYAANYTRCYFDYRSLGACRRLAAVARAAARRHLRRNRAPGVVAEGRTAAALDPQRPR